MAILADSPENGFTATLAVHVIGHLRRLVAGDDAATQPATKRQLMIELQVGDRRGGRDVRVTLTTRVPDPHRERLEGKVTELLREGHALQVIDHRVQVLRDLGLARRDDGLPFLLARDPLSRKLGRVRRDPVCVLRDGVQELVRINIVRIHPCMGDGLVDRVGL
jgi:hypothetical protein